MINSQVVLVRSLPGLQRTRLYLASIALLTMQPKWNLNSEGTRFVEGFPAPAEDINLSGT